MIKTKYLVYKILNLVNGKYYIVRTIQPLWKMWSNHKTKARFCKKNNIKTGTAVALALNKEGVVF